MKPRLLIAVSLSLVAAVASACNIPVFRYALERWVPDACELVVLHDGSMSSDDTTFLSGLVNQSIEQDGLANAKVTRVDISGKLDDEKRSLVETLRGQGVSTFPHLVARTTVRGEYVNHWHGTIEQAKSTELLLSPVRRELSRRLLSGHSVVWLVVKSNNKTRNKKAKDFLKTNFRELESSIQLPEGIGLPGSELHSELPLVVKFSLIEVDADDPAERFLVDLLKGFDPQAIDDGDPLLVPVFGRGRALEVIPASEIDAKLMEELTAFLSGACSCQVKNRNPGFDLLLSADWDTELFGEGGVRPPPATPGTQRGKGPELLTIPPGRR